MNKIRKIICWNSSGPIRTEKHFKTGWNVCLEAISYMPGQHIRIISENWFYINVIRNMLDFLYPIKNLSEPEKVGMFNNITFWKYSASPYLATITDEYSNLIHIIDTPDLHNALQHLNRKNVHVYHAPNIISNKWENFLDKLKNNVK